MSNNLPGLVVSLEANMAKFSSDMDKAAAKTDQSMLQMVASTERVQKAVKSLEAQAQRGVSVGNVDGSISSLCILMDDLVGAKVVRHVTLGQYLDAVNFAGGNATADPTQEFPADVWFIEQKTGETNEVVEFELASALDLQGQMLPRRQIIANLCSFTYRGAYCNYTGTAKFDSNDQPVTDPALDVCGKRLGSCKKRFGDTQVLNFGGFPAAALVQ